MRGRREAGLRGRAGPLEGGVEACCTVCKDFVSASRTVRHVCYRGRRVSLRRLLFVLVLVLTASVAVVSDASAGGIRDWEPCPDSGGGELLCPVGTVGVPYSVKFRAVEEPPCQPGEDTWHIINDAPPTGLTLSTDGTLSGTPTQAGTFSFWVEMRLPDNDHCNGTTDTTQERFTVPINPGVPKLTIGPESIATTGTVGAAYTVAMTASVSDPKTWSIVAGSLPPGLAIGASDGVISGAPTAAGSFTFTVRAAIDATRSDTKTLTIVVRNPLEIAASAPFDPESPVVRTEVGMRFNAALVATGGFGTYTWSLVGDVPPGLTFDPVGGTLIGQPTEAGSYRFTVSVADSESRATAYAARIIVAERLAVSTLRFRNGKVGRFYQVKLRSFGGVGPVSWRIKRGPLPRGIRFDRLTGSLFGTPTKSGTWRIAVEVVDSLGVKSTATITITVGSQLKLRKSG